MCSTLSVFVALVIRFGEGTADPPLGLAFSKAFGNDMVLQQQPAKAAVFGTVDVGSQVIVKVEGNGASYSVAADVSGGTWKAFLKPAIAGGSWTITATSGSTSVNLQRVTFGDVWYCGGQSNMALPLVHTLSRNKSVEAILAGKYANLRIHGISGNMNPDQPWATMKDVIKASGKSKACPDDSCQFFQYSSTCWYFGESLADELADAAPPIGLIHTSYGGSTIEQWLDNKTIAECGNATLSPSNQKWHDQRVLPYVEMTMKGWVWYQGENDMHASHGNSKLGYGYGCLMPKLVSSWRKLWSVVDGTTYPMAPFGLVTLAPTGGEGGNSMGTMRWAQTANYGVMPNPAMPNTFVAQAFDLTEPYSNITCYKKKCCWYNYDPEAFCEGCEGYCASTGSANFYMGPIHPRDKKPVGQRLAQAGAVIGYGKEGLYTGPTISGCSMAKGKITLRFNSSLLGSDKVVVRNYSKGLFSSKIQVLTNRSLFCMQTAGRYGNECIDDGTGHDAGVGPFDDLKTTWVNVNIEQAGSTSIIIDLSNSNGVAYAIRYAWEGDCCEGRPATSDPCPIASCPIMAEQSRLPANPFVAKIVNGKCECVSPQVCDENVHPAEPSIVV